MNELSFHATVLYINTGLPYDLVRVFLGKIIIIIKNTVMEMF